MRFKYRAFINNEMKDVHYFYEADNDDVFVCTNSKDNSGFFAPKKALMQSTGLKDSKGNLIYEGDILIYRQDENDTYERAVVVWGGEYDYPAFELEGTDFDGVNGLSWLCGNDWEMTVLGNIYEDKYDVLA